MRMPDLKYPMPVDSDAAREIADDILRLKYAALAEVGVAVFPSRVDPRVMATASFDREQAIKALALAFQALHIDFDWLDEDEYIERLIERRRQRLLNGEPVTSDVGAYLISNESWFPPELRRRPVFA